MSKGKRVFLQRKIFLPVALLILLPIVIFVFFVQQPRFLCRKLASENPSVFFYAETHDKVLALTIDDAPSSSLTPAILDLLGRYEVQATFFIIGQHAIGNEDLIMRMKAEGHELGNHLKNDEASISLSKGDFEENLLAVEKIISPLGVTKWFRPGSGWFSPEMLETAHELGYRCCLGSLYPFDNMLHKPDLIRNMVMDRILPGTILILHEGEAKREYIIPLLEQLIPALKERGYRFLTVSQLAEMNSIKE